MHRTFVVYLALVVAAASVLLGPTAVTAQSPSQRRQQLAAQRQLYLQQLAQRRALQLAARRQLYLQQLAAQQQLYAMGQGRASSVVQQQGAQSQAAQLEAAQQQYRQQLVQQQQELYQQLYKDERADRPLTVEERKHQAIAKILGAVFVKVAGKAAEQADNKFIAIIGPVLADRISNALVESSVSDLFPDLSPVAVRAVARAARLCAEGKLNKIEFARVTAKDELLEILKADPNLKPAVEAADFLIDLGQAADRLRR